MPEPRENDDANRHDLEHTIVALEGRGLTVGGPIGLERYLRHLAMIGPASGGLLGAFWRTAMDEHHVGMLDEHLVENGRDELMVGVIGAAEKAIFGPFGGISSVSALRRAAMKSRLSIIAAVRCL